MYILSLQSIIIYSIYSLAKRVSDDPLLLGEHGLDLVGQFGPFGSCVRWDVRPARAASVRSSPERWIPPRMSCQWYSWPGLSPPVTSNSTVVSDLSLASVTSIIWKQVSLAIERISNWVIVVWHTKVLDKASLSMWRNFFHTQKVFEKTSSA